ncbi:MAG: fructosamine kinase family protein [Naasia sp.]
MAKVGGIIRKERLDAPDGFFEAEAAGLDWLRSAESDGGARVVEVIGVGPGWIELDRLDSARPTAEAAREFGAGLAATHASGAPAFGAPPDGWSGPCFIGRQSLSTEPSESWGRFYADQRVRPYLRVARSRGHIDASGAALVERACALIADGRFDDGRPPARLHGDLWNGNLLWTPDGAVLIDPAAHGGHPETDLAMLDLFGCPRLDDILDGYQDATPLREGWERRIPLHQLHPLAVHAASHGSSYAGPLLDAAGRIVAW